MDLKTFVISSLQQIVDAVETVQATPSGKNVAAETYNIPAGHNVFTQGTDGMFTIVDFDVSVFAENKEDGSVLRVSGAEVINGSSTTSRNASRIRFSIHVRLPTGARAPSSTANNIGYVSDDYDPFKSR